MKRLTLTLLPAAWLSAAWLSAAHAQQIYDLDIVMKNVATFAGTFVYNASGTGECSAAFCGSGVTPEFSSVFIKDPLSIDGPMGPNAFTGVEGSGSNLTFFDTYFGTPGKSSYVYTLSFDLLAPLGSQHIGITDITFSTDMNVTGTYSCGGPDRIVNPPGEKCPTAKLNLTKAPEIDSRGAAAAVVLLLGALAVWRGAHRRTPARARPLIRE
jgi:hypothetical protein